MRNVKRAMALCFMLAALAVVAFLMLVTTPAYGEQDGNWYWKDGGWIDYAPSGLPDFDQKQDFWGWPDLPPPPLFHWTYCGPVAAANSLWWFDSKFEPSPVGPLPGGPPSTIPDNDNYFLVEGCEGQDDHDPHNVTGTTCLVNELAYYFDTDARRTMGGIIPPPRSGTEVHDMSRGLQWYLYGGNPKWGAPPRDHKGSYYDDYHVQLVKMPTWEWVVDEVERSEDVILLLGFWQDYVPDPDYEEWWRLGGHYVTVAGINAAEKKIAFSDPFLDNAEVGGVGFGRVLSGTLIVHAPIPGHMSNVHNDAGNVSHDSYLITTTVNSPAGLWEIQGYLFNLGIDFVKQNCPVEYEGQQRPDPAPTPEFFVEVEYAIAMSPFYWKPGGEWVDTWWQEQWITEFWHYEDDGDSCLPDFSWKGSEDFYYDGPVAVANSLWWFDSKAETLMTGGWAVAPEVGISDHYPLVTSVDPAWDDHAISNTHPFIDKLATNYLDTSLSGTLSTSMTSGIDAYLAAAGVDDDFYAKTEPWPTWDWITREVRTCEDVILLLGFYEKEGMEWERKGGHWVNAAGVSGPNQLIGLSDPAIDHAISESISYTMYLGRVFPPEHLGTAFTKEEKRHPQNISHDIYPVTTMAELGDQLILKDYPFTHTSVISNYVGLNGDGSDVDDWHNPLLTLVEWAIGVSPYSDLVITKTAVVTEVMPGDQVTFTIRYANTGLAAADPVTITDLLPPGALTNIQVTSYPPISYTPGPPPIWTPPRMHYGQSGTITITGESLLTTTLTNTAIITGLNAIGGPTPDRDPTNNISKIGPWCIDLTAIKIYGATSGEPGTYTFTTAYEPNSASEPINYLWDNGDAAPTSTRTLDTGSYTLVVTATNCTDALVTDTHRITITAPACIETQMVELELTSATPIHVGQAAGFEADISPDDAGKPYTYTITTDGIASAEQSSSQDPLVFTQTFTTVGTHTVRIDVWNCDMTQAQAISDTHRITITAPACVETQMVELNLTSAAPIHVGQAAGFEADISPDDAGKPYTYTITTDAVASAEQSSSQDPLVFTRTFATVGTHTVRIDVWNCDMTQAQAISDTTDVDVSGHRVYLPVVLKNH